MKTIISDHDTLCEAVSNEILSLVRNNPGANLALSRSFTMEGVYDRLSSACALGVIDLSSVRLYDIGAFAEKALFQDTLPDRFGISPDRTFPLNTDTIEIYNSTKFDLILLSLGTKGQLAFNDVGTLYSSIAGERKLTAALKRNLRSAFPKGTVIPDSGYSIGISNIMSAGKILVLCTGDDLADAVYATMYCRTDSTVPSGFLQLAREVILYVDKSAASKLLE